MAAQRKQTAQSAVREIRRRTRRKFSSEEKIRIVLEGLSGELSVAELCRHEKIAATLYYRWSKEFLEAGKKQLSGDTVREATSDEVLPIALLVLIDGLIAADGYGGAGNAQHQGGHDSSDFRG